MIDGAFQARNAEACQETPDLAVSGLLPNTPGTPRGSKYLFFFLVLGLNHVIKSLYGNPQSLLYWYLEPLGR